MAFGVAVDATYGPCSCVSIQMGRMRAIRVMRLSLENDPQDNWLLYAGILVCRNPTCFTFTSSMRIDVASRDRRGLGQNRAQLGHLHFLQ